MVTSPTVAQPVGTFLANVRDGRIQFPKPMHLWCEDAGWNLFHVEIVGDDRLNLSPVLDDDAGPTGDFQSCLSSDGRLWIPAVMRGMVGLGEQSVMMRIEGPVIGVFLRKVFETLGFGP